MRLIKMEKEKDKKGLNILTCMLRVACILGVKAVMRSTFIYFEKYYIYYMLG